MGKSSVTGGREVSQALRKVVPGILVPLNEASRKALKPMVAATKANAPVEEGALRRSLAIKRGRSSKVKPVHYVGPRADYQEGDRRPVKYAHIIEFGRAPNADGKGEIKGTRFFTRAFEATAQQALRILKVELPAAIERRITKLAVRERKKR